MMLYEEIRQRCRMYHERDEFAYDGSYRRYNKAKDQAKWDNPKTLDYAEVSRLVDFLNEWKTRMPSNSDNITHLLNNLRSELPLLNTLRSATLLDVNFDETTKQTIAKCFDGIAQTQRYESVGASKMLNVAINPNLFVIWDTAIQSGYGLGRYGSEYAREFLPKMQRIAKRAVDQVRTEEGLSCADAIQSFTDHCEKSYSLAKIIDEYNYTKYTGMWRL